MTDIEKLDDESDFSSQMDSNSPRMLSSNSNYYEYEETFQKLPLGLVMSHKKSSATLCVTGFVNIAASRDGRILVGDELIRVNGVSLEDMKSKAVLKVINASTCPLTIHFRRRLLDHMKYDSDFELPAKTRMPEDPEEGHSNATPESIQANASTISSMVTEINQISLKMKGLTGVGNDAIKSINFSKLSSFRDASAGLGYRLDIALEKLEMLERKYLPTASSDNATNIGQNSES